MFDEKYRRSRRWTLLCCLTCFSLIILFIITLPLDLIKEKQRKSHRVNRSTSIHLLQYRSSLIKCGKSVVQEKYSSQIIENLSKISKENDFIHFNQQIEDFEKKSRLIHWLDSILNSCFLSKEYSMLEQDQPTILRRLMSFLRKEFFYLSGFFTKTNSLSR